MSKEQPTKVKICGITSLQDARFAAGVMAHYLGFIFFDESPRYIEPAQAGAIINWIEGPESVGVFVNHPLDELNEIASVSGLDLVQLHGNESPEYCAMVDKPVIKAIRVASDSTAEKLENRITPYLDTVDFLLFDTSKEGVWGGTGTPFDWSLITGLTAGKPFFLSGGIDENNVKKACKMVNPYAVDLSSSLEREPGVKDYEKIEVFMNRMKEIWGEEPNE